MRSLDAELGALLEEGASLLGRECCAGSDAEYFGRMERTLFGALFRKECLLAQEPVGAASLKEARAMEAVIDRYAQYRTLLREKMTAAAAWEGERGARGRSRLYAASTPERLIVLLTRRCQLRCAYCDIPEYGGDISPDDVDKAVDFLFTSSRPSLTLQFFGGEPLLRFDLLQNAVARALESNKRHKKNLSFLVTTNGLLLQRDKIAFLKRHNFNVEVSCDGTRDSQLRHRKSGGPDYYPMLLRNLEAIRASGSKYYLIMTVTPDAAGGLSENFKYLAELGHRRIQINYAIGVPWSRERALAFLEQMDAVLDYVSARPGLELVNATELRREPIVLNGELTVDRDGGLFLESGFLNLREGLSLGAIDAAGLDARGVTPFESYWRLSKACAGRDPSVRRILINNIRMGWLADRWLRRWLLRRAGDSRLRAKQWAAAAGADS